MSEKQFKLGTNYPNEGFVQSALQGHFEGLGFKQGKLGHIDYVGVHPVSGERWVIEAKGETSDVGLDFRTGLGQIVQSMANAPATFGLAVPHTQKFLNQCSKVAPWVREALQLHWLLVDAAGGITVVAPREPLPGLGA